MHAYRDGDIKVVRITGRRKARTSCGTPQGLAMQDEAKSESIAERQGRCRDEKKRWESKAGGMPLNEHS